jgi:hypothetical protein
MNKGRLENWPVYLAVIVFLLMVWLILNISLRLNQGHLIYALDDAYIGMAMARNFAQHGVWGVTRYGFSSCSSPPLWTLLLSLAYYVGGVHQLTPFVMNLVLTLLILVTADTILRQYEASGAARALTLFGIILFVPLPMMVFAGMEQALQTFVAMLFVFYAARWLSGESPATSRGDSIRVLLLAPIVTGVRMEGMFLVIAIALFVVAARRWIFALALVGLGYLPWFVYGLISISKGWFWLPTSLLLKASTPDFSSPAALVVSLLNPIYVNLHDAMHLLVLMVALPMIYILASDAGQGARDSRQIMGTVIFLTGLAHLEFVGTGTLYRYDYYWSALAILYAGLQLSAILPERRTLLARTAWTAPKACAYAALALLFVFPLAFKGGHLLWYLPRCTTEIFDQQYQMGLFVHRYYENSTVALNDIGAVNYLADVHCLDLAGLANVQVAAARRRHAFHVSDMSRFSGESGVRLAIIYDVWFPEGVPPGWIRVGRWTIPGNINAGSDTVSFYATSSAEAEYLRSSLIDFSSHLPAEVIQRGG